MAHKDADVPRTRRAVISGTGILVAITFLALVGVGATVSLATGSWWALAAAVAVHGVATIAFMVVFVPVLDREGPDDDPPSDDGGDRAPTPAP